VVSNRGESRLPAGLSSGSGRPRTTGCAAGVVVVFASGLLLLYHAGLSGTSVRRTRLASSPAFVLPPEVVVLDSASRTRPGRRCLIATVAVYVANYQGGGIHTPFQTAVTSRPARLRATERDVARCRRRSQRVLLQEGRRPARRLTPSIFRRRPDRSRPCWRAGRRASGATSRASPARLSARRVGDRTRVLHDTREPGIPIISMQAVVAVVLGGIILGEEDLPVVLVCRWHCRGRRRTDRPG